MVIPKHQWKWFGSPAHLVVSSECSYHMATQIGEYLVSTVGEWLPGEGVREILAGSRGVQLEGRGDDREADFIEKLGYQEIGLGRLYETMVFRAGDPCNYEECGACGMPEIDGEELAFAGYNNRGDAARGHYSMCERVAADQAWLSDN